MNHNPITNPVLDLNYNRYLPKNLNSPSPNFLTNTNNHLVQQKNPFLDNNKPYDIPNNNPLNNFYGIENSIYNGNINNAYYHLNNYQNIPYNNPSTNNQSGGRLRMAANNIFK